MEQGCVPWSLQRSCGAGCPWPGSQGGFGAVGSILLLGLMGLGSGAKGKWEKVEMIRGQGEGVEASPSTGTAEPLGFPKLVHGRELVTGAGISQFDGKCGELGDVIPLVQIMGIFYSKKTPVISTCHRRGGKSSARRFRIFPALHGSSLTLPSFPLQIWFFLHF